MTAIQTSSAAGTLPPAALEQASALHIVGVDLSLTATGVACKHGVATIKSSGHAADDLTSRHHRLVTIREEVLTWTRGVDLVVLEQPAYSRVQGHTHDRSGLWWLLVHALIATDVTVVEVSPTARAKYATGKGNAGKDEVLAAAVRRFTGYPISNNNEADAVVLAAMGHDALGDPLTPLPATHRLALNSIPWPTLPGAAT